MKEEKPNLYILDRDPVLAAHSLCNEHLEKAVVTTVNLLCLANRYERKARLLPTLDPKLEPLEVDESPRFKKLATWMVKDHYHWLWVYTYGKELASEYAIRFGKSHELLSHLSTAAIHVLPPVRQQYKGIRKELEKRLQFLTPEDCFKHIRFQVFVPGKDKPGDPVLAYRLHYAKAMKGQATWTKREPPGWWPHSTSKRRRSKMKP